MRAALSKDALVQAVLQKRASASELTLEPELSASALTDEDMGEELDALVEEDPVASRRALIASILERLK